MYKLLFLLLFSQAGTTVMGQQLDSLSKEDLRLLDSMFKNDEFIKLMVEQKKSYVDVNIGMGNRIFSIKNNALNAGQAQTNKIFYTPSVGYYHKNGFAVTVSGYLASDDGEVKMYQYAFSPSYTYSNKKITAGISYTRFIEGSEASFDVNPFKNDFYASALYKKSWVQPGIALGFSFGKQESYYDTAFWYTPPLQSARIIHVRDTITTRLSGLSLTLSATHQWAFYELLNKKDAIRLQPVLMLNAGSQKWHVTHSSSLFERRAVVQYYLKRRFGDGTTSSNFNLQSMAFSGALTYYYGKFYLQPQIYLDYYLPATTEERITSLFSVTAGISFY
jgi:hypothetical protein